MKKVSMTLKNLKKSCKYKQKKSVLSTFLGSEKVSPNSGNLKYLFAMKLLVEVAYLGLEKIVNGL